MRTCFLLHLSCILPRQNPFDIDSPVWLVQETELEVNRPAAWYGSNSSPVSCYLGHSSGMLLKPNPV
jgi:hypothetical protein